METVVKVDQQTQTDVSSSLHYVGSNEYQFNTEYSHMRNEYLHTIFATKGHCKPGAVAIGCM